MTIMLIMKYAVTTFKGGSGKSTISLHLAIGLAQQGKRVLFVDLDHQGNTTKFFTGRKDHLPNLGHGLILAATAEQITTPTNYKNIDIMPGGNDLAGLSAKLSAPQEVNREMRLAGLLEEIGLQYDACVFDCPPERGTINYNGILAADKCYLPCAPGQWDLDGINGMLTEINRINAAMRMPAKPTKVILSRMTRNKVSKEVEKFVRANLGALVCSNSIPESPKVPEAVFGKNQTVWEYAPEHAAAIAMKNLVNEITRHDEKQSRVA